MRVAGIFRYLRIHRPWNISLIRSRIEFNRHSIGKMLADGVDGMIVAIPHVADEINMLAETELPIVLMTNTAASDFSSPLISNCIVDNAAIGLAAAHYFLSHGKFNAAAYVHDDRVSRWSQERESAFISTIGRRMPVFSFNKSSRETGSGSLADLGDWLSKLPRPAAILAANDSYATQVLNACRTKHLKVPGCVSVLGVDNDDLLAENAMPSLSSIEPDFDEAGYQAAAEMERLLTARRGIRGRNISCGIKKLVERNSTSYLSPSAQLVSSALQYIHQHAAEKVTAGDVVRYLRVSRNLLELRMREVHGSSLAATLRGRRIDLAKDALARTTMPIGKVFQSCGFGNIRSAENIFKAQTGTTPSEWRAMHSHSRNQPTTR